MHAFTYAVRNYLLENRKLHVAQEVLFTNNCSAQYKSYKPFYVLSKSTIPTIHSYFGRRHGKSLMDSERAVVKKSVDDALRCEGKIADSAKDFVSQFKNSDVNIHDLHQKGAIRTLLLVNDVKPVEIPKTKTLIGTQKLHSMKSIGTPGYVAGRNLSCFCNACMSEQSVSHALTPNMLEAKKSIVFSSKEARDQHMRKMMNLLHPRSS